jgi:hypothetical protein
LVRRCATISSGAGAQRRWTTGAPIDLDLVASDDREDSRQPWAAPAPRYALDPALVVLRRERLRLTWQELSEAHQRITAAHAARRTAHQTLDTLTWRRAYSAVEGAPRPYPFASSAAGSRLDFLEA